MKRTSPLLWRIFIAILAIALISVLATGLIARAALSREFESYIATFPDPMSSGRGMGRMMLGAAEQTFLNGVDQGILISAVVAVAVAAIGAYLLARYLSRPLSELTHGARELASGDLDHRVDADGPQEVMDLAVAFNEMADSISEGEVLRRRLVADVAHELRNPIASLRAQIEGVDEGVLELDKARIRSLAEDVTHLSRLVDDLQELSLAEAGHLSYDKVDLDLAVLIDSEIIRMKPLVTEEVELRSETDGAPLIFADELRLTQVLRNMLSNATRHTATGSITVSTRLDGKDVVVEVTDTGEGISPEDLPYVFERFYRADAARSVSTGGAGIGLAIAKQIVVDHDGEVFAESEPGVRTTVGFRLPLVHWD